MYYSSCLVGGVGILPHIYSRGVGAHLFINRGSHGSQGSLNSRRERVCAAEHAPRGRFHILERRHALADIVECGAVGPAECVRVIPPHPERGFMTLAVNASRHGQCSAQQRLGFFEAP